MARAAPRTYPVKVADRGARQDVDARAWHWLLVLAAMLALVFVAFGPARTGFFIADDLTNLRFVRMYDGSLADVFVPGRVPSAPVTGSRYMPLHLVHWWTLDRVLGDEASAYHVVGFVLHALASTLVVALTWTLHRGPGRAWASLGAGVMFALTRLNTQTVVWISSGFRCLSLASFLLGVIAVWRIRRTPLAVVACVAAFTVALLLNPDFVMGSVAFFALAWSTRTESPDRARRLACGAFAAAVVTVAFVVANVVSNTSQPDELAFRAAEVPQRWVTFLANLVVPFALPWPAKIGCAALVLAFVVRWRDRHTLALLAPVLASAGAWAVASYGLAPRYLYVASAFFAIAVAQAAAQALTTFAARPGRAGMTGALATIAVAGFVACNLVAIRRGDLVHFQYLAHLPRQLDELARTRPGARVHIHPRATLADADLAFFADRVQFVGSPNDATHVVDTGAGLFRGRLGEGFDRAYWYMPWFSVRIE